MKNGFVLLLIIFVLGGCEGEKEKVFRLPENARELIAGDSNKTWKLARRLNNDTRMNMGDCFLSYRLTIKADGTLNDNAGEKADCGETLNAEWQFARNELGNAYLKMESEQLPGLMNIDKDYKFFKLLNLSKEVMVMQFQHKQFSSKETTITDIYVPEGVKVKDRHFHW